MNLQILRELEAYIKQNMVEESLLMMEESPFHPQQQIHYFRMNANLEITKKKDSKQLQDQPELDFSAFRRDRKPEESMGDGSQNETVSHIERAAIYRESYAVQTPKEPKEPDLEEYIKKQKSKETFSSRLLQYIDQTGLADAEIYRRAGIDRRHFSKIRCDKDYKPKKATVLALCLALKLDKGETEELLSLAGYSLSNGDTGDLVIKFCIERGIYDLMEVNDALVYFGQKAIGVVG